MKKFLQQNQCLSIATYRFPLHEILVLASVYVLAGYIIFQQYSNPLLTSTINNPSAVKVGPTKFCAPPPPSFQAITAIGTSGQRTIPVGSNIANLRRWSQTSSWPGGIKPGINDDVVIANNTTLVLDENVNVKSITVNGQLIVDLTKNIQVSTQYLLISGANAYFEWGTETEKYQQKGSITLIGAVSETNATLKSVLINNGGRAEFHGKNKTSWTTLAANANAGSNQIQISDNNNMWEVGDEIVIVSSRISQNEAEKRTITAISADRRTLTLNANLSFPHIGNVHTYNRATDGKSWTADMRAEVGLLTKSIKIQGDNASTLDGKGGHIMVHSIGIANIENVELYRMGQKSIIGRYPFHWHLLENRGLNQYFRNNSVHETFNRAITIHGTESARVENNFCYNHIGHGIFLEDGSERFNIIRNNVVVLTKRPLPGQQLTPSDNEANEVQNRTPASYWITNANNTFEGNIAAGTEGTGFWFAMPQSPMGLSASITRFANIQPYREPLGVFRNNKAHSCMSGFDIFDQLSASHSLVKNGAWDRTDLRIFQSCTWYACDLAVYGGIGSSRRLTENVIFRENVFIDNLTAVMHANYSMIENSVFVANSGENVFSGERKLNRGYDGSCTIKDCHMVGWQAENANYVQNTGGAKKHVNYRISGMTMNHPGPPRMNLPNYSAIPKGGVGSNSAAHPRFWSYVHWDIDGSVSGKPNTSIITNHPLCRDGSEVRYENWTNIYRTDRRFAYMLLDFPGDPKMTIVRRKAGTPKAGQYYINTDGPDGYYGTFIHFPVIVNDGFEYTLQFESMGTAKRFNLNMEDDYIAGDQVFYRIKSFGALAGLTISNAIRFSSEAQLRSATQTGYAVVGSDLLIKMVSIASSPDISCTVTWTGDITLPMLDTDGDGISDYQESVNGTDPVGNETIPENPPLPMPTIKTVWEFNANNNMEEWSLVNNLSGSVSAGRLSVQPTGTDPYLVSPNNLMVPSETYKYIRVRLKSANAGQLQLYWSRDGGYGFGQERVEVIPIKAVSTDYIDYYVDLSTNPNWVNTINRLRIDPEVGVGNSVEIDRISFETTLPACAAIIAPSATTICQGTPFALTTNLAPGADYVWRNGTTIIGGNTNTLAVTSTGNYTVEIKYPTGCTVISAVRPITVNPASALPTATTELNYCQNATAVALTATGTNLKWYTVASGGTPLIVAPTPSTANVGTTNYYVTQTTGTCESARRLIAVNVNNCINKNPVVSFAAPQVGATLYSPLDLFVKVNASDIDGTIANVKLFINDKLVREDLASPYEWGAAGQNDPLLKGLLAGTYILRAVATDNAGGVTTIQQSITVSPVVVQNILPSVTITSPANGTIFNAPATVSILANATDGDGSVSKVEFYNGTTLLATDLTSPYSFSMSNLAAGNYSIAVKATDNLGASTVKSVSFVVNAVVVPPPTTIGINGPSCVSAGSAASYSLTSDLVAISTINYYSNSGAVITTSPTDNKKVTIQFPSYLNGSSIVLTAGVNYGVSPWYKEYTKTIKVGGCSAKIGAVLTPQPTETNSTLVMEDNQKILSVIIFNSIGEVVYEASSLNEEALVLGDNLAAGIYVVQVVSEEGTTTTRMIKR